MTLNQARAAYEAARAADRAGRTVATMQAVKDAWSELVAVSPVQKARPQWGSRAGRMQAKLRQQERQQLLTLTWGRRRAACDGPECLGCPECDPAGRT